jgi:hypothetical protein
MAKEVVPYLLDNDETVLVEIETVAPKGRQQISRRSEEGTPPKWSQSLDQVMPAIEQAFARISNSSLMPSEIELEVGVKFAGEAGAIIAKTSAEASLVLTLKWNRPTGTESKPAQSP